MPLRFRDSSHMRNFNRSSDKLRTLLITERTAVQRLWLSCGFMVIRLRIVKLSSSENCLLKATSHCVYVARARMYNCTYRRTRLPRHQIWSLFPLLQSIIVLAQEIVIQSSSVIVIKDIVNTCLLWQFFVNLRCPKWKIYNIKSLVSVVFAYCDNFLSGPNSVTITEKDSSTARV